MSGDRSADLLRSRELLLECFSGPLRLREAAREARLSPFHFHRLFRRAFGETPLELLTRRRLELARELLAHTDRSVTEICVEVGYSSLGSFSARFKARLGLAPSEYRRAVRRSFAVPRLWPVRFVPGCVLTMFGVEARSEKRGGLAL